MKELITKFWTWHSARPCEAIIGPGHNYVDLHEGRWFEKFENTGEYIDGKPIQKRYDQKVQECTRCKHKHYIEIKIY